MLLCTLPHHARRSLRRLILAHTVSFLHETATIVFVVSRRIRDVPSSSYLRTRSLAPWPGLHHTPPRTSMKGRDAVSSTWWSQTTALTPTSHTPLVYTATPSRNTIQHYHTVGHLHDSHAGGHTETWGWDEQQALWDLITEHPHLTAAALKRRLCPPAPPISTRTIARYRRIFDFTPRHARVQARGAIGHHEERADWAWKASSLPHHHMAA